MKLPVTPSFALDGKRALVTGASRGIGMGAAVALAKAGSDVTLAARSEKDLQGVCDALTEQGASASAVALDVTDIAAVAEFVENEKPFDILINNAGINRPGPIETITPEDFDAVMNVNLRAAYFVAQSVVKKMTSAGNGGVIINTSSQMGHVGGIDRTVYCSSKFAIEGFSKALAIETAPHNIRVNTICPTFIATPLTKSTLDDPERVAWIKSKIKLGRIGQIEDLMGAFVFLSSDAASLITGTSLLVDGGWTAG